MNIVSHGLLAYCVANKVAVSRRDRALITFAGMAPDLDGFGYPFEALTKGSDKQILWFTDFHHTLCHNLLAALIVSMLVAVVANRKVHTMLWTFVLFNFHLFCDVIGGRGPDGASWPLDYLSPFAHSVILEWSGQWELNAWPNFVISIAALIWIIHRARLLGYSPLEFISQKLDNIFVETLRKRWPLT